MRTVRARPAKFAIVVAVVAVRAENLRAHRTSRRDSIQVQHVRKQAGLRKRAAPGMPHGMARCCRNRKLWNQIERIASRNGTHREISIDRLDLFAGTGSVTAQAVLILIHSPRKHASTVDRADPPRGL